MPRAVEETTASSAPTDVWVPHILHQTWRTSEVPLGFRKSVASWRKLQPSWKYKLWDDDANQRLVDSKYPWLQAAFQEMSGIQRADIMRYLYMHAFGGVYADLDVALVRHVGAELTGDNVMLLCTRKHGGTSSSQVTMS